MAEAVVGAAIGASVDVLLRNLLSFPIKEISLYWNLTKNLENLKQSVSTIREFLEDADMKQVPDKSVNRWLKKLEAVAFDADYVLDKLNYEVLRKKVETDYKMKKQVRSFFCIHKPCAFRCRMARKIRDITKDLESINREACNWGLPMRLAGPHARGATTEASAHLETDSFTVDRVFVGRDNDVENIVKTLTSSLPDQVISVLPIVGMGGLGKTTLARKVCKDNNVVSHFAESIWVHVTENFDPVIVLKGVVGSLTGEKIEGSREVVVKKFREKLENKRYLLILDDVWNEDTEKWDNFITSLEGISPVKGNKIIVTTRKRNVASIVESLGVHELRGLSEENCWFIIKANAFGGESIPVGFETIGKNIAKRCGGLPLAAKVVGSLLRGKSEDEWQSIEKKWLSDFGGDGNSVSKILKLSFDNLQSPLLKKCFAYYSVIPKGWWTEKEELIHLWMAEGYLQNDEEKDMETVGNNVFNLLAQSSLLQVGRKDYYGNVKRCSMHALVHDLASSVLNPKFPDNTNRVRYICRPFVDETSPISKEHSRCLRALFYSGKVSDIMLRNLKRLHVLILKDEDMKELPIEIGKLFSLRFLDVSHTRIECLPESIGDLYHLQTLRATKEYGGKSYLRKLPDTLKYLVSLRHLYIPNTKLPQEIGKLVSLQTLPYFQVGDEEGSRITELGRLTNLRGEIEIHNLEKVCDKEEAKSANLFHKPNILKLKLVWNESGQSGTNDENVLEGLQPYSNLKRLEINGFKGRSFPLWTLRMEVREELESHWVRLDKLLVIKLSDCKECEEIPMLGHLPRLKCLYLHHLSNVKSIGSSFYGIEENGVHKESIVVFPELEKLELIGMPKLTTWAEVELPSSSESQPSEVSVFGRLEHLKITNCGQLTIVPTHFPYLKELEIDDMESEVPLALFLICGSTRTSLSKLVIREVRELVCLPDELFHKNGDLLELEIWDCPNLTHLVPRLEGGGASLRKLEIRNCRSFKELPEDMHNLNALEGLRIWGCPNLRSVTYPSSGGGGGGGGQLLLSSLRYLDFTCCNALRTLPIEMLEACALSLEDLWLMGSMSLTNLPQVLSFLHKMPRLVDLRIEGAPRFNEAAAEIGSLHSLQCLGIGGSPDCGDYDSFKASLDRIIPSLQSLVQFRLFGMEHWDALPDQLLQLNTLRELSLYGFGVEALPEWLERFSSLQCLVLFNFQKLRRLPSKKAMQGLTKLTKLVIEECPLLKQTLAEEEAGDDDSEWSKISHIRSIEVDDRPFRPAPSQ